NCASSLKPSVGFVPRNALGWDEAADCGLLSADSAAGIRRVKGAKRLGMPVGTCRYGPKLCFRARMIDSRFRGAAMHEVSLIRLYTLRICYLILAVGLGLYMWPSVLHHTADLAITHGIQLSLLAGLGLTAVLGLRYPVQMLPLLLFELIWKTIYLL